jgi:hypothetical protein
MVKVLLSNALYEVVDDRHVRPPLAAPMQARTVSAGSATGIVAQTASGRKEIRMRTPECCHERGVQWPDDALEP